MRVSQLFRNTVRLSNKRHYQIAHAAGLHPSTLSRLINGIEKIKKNDRRVLKIAAVLGLKTGDCFCDEESLL